MTLLRLSFISVVLLRSVAAQEKPAPAEAGGYSQMETLTRVMELVRQNYVDEKKVTYERLVAAALRGMLSELDPHSQFIAPELNDALKEGAEATPEGAGFTLAPRTGGMVIVTVQEEGPAARAGMMPGDQVLKIGDTHTAGISYLDGVRLLRGRPGEPLRLTTWRAASQETRELEIIREAGRQDSVRDAMLLEASLTGDTKIGYIRIVQFTAKTATELADALDRMEDQGLAALVLDLRNNPGGLLGGTVDALGEFLPPGTVVVTTEGRDPAKNPPPLKTPARQRRARTYPLAVLINHASASGAELMAGALQDLGRAVLVGTTSFGKGSVQSIIPGDNHTAVRLTTAHYFTPKHQAIHEHGVVPDIIAPLTYEEESKLMDYLRKTTEAAPDPVRLAKLGDRQLDRAVTALKGVVIFRAMQKK